jgi:hypothetical protein
MIFVSTSPAAGPIRFMKFLNRCAANSVRRSVHRQVIERRFELRLFVFAQFQLVRVFFGRCEGSLCPGERLSAAATVGSAVAGEAVKNGSVALRT